VFHGFLLVVVSVLTAITALAVVSSLLETFALVAGAHDDDEAAVDLWVDSMYLGVLCVFLWSLVAIT
jgi:hypothetical protein